jgi:hypothetical protein
MFSQKYSLQNFTKKPFPGASPPDPTLVSTVKNILYRISTREALWWGPLRGPPRAPYTDFLRRLFTLKYMMEFSH